MSLLHKLTRITTPSKKRVGRGYGSGLGGHTSGRGEKGQKSRVGSLVPLWFEGGQLPLIKRLPMQRGKGKLKVISPTAEVSLAEINTMKSEVVSLDTLKLEKMINPKFKKAKIIGTGTLSKKVTIKSIKVSESARKQIEALGGSVEA